MPRAVVTGVVLTDIVEVVCSVVGGGLKLAKGSGGGSTSAEADVLGVGAGWTELRPGVVGGSPNELPRGPVLTRCRLLTGVLGNRLAPVCVDIPHP